MKGFLNFFGNCYGYSTLKNEVSYVIKHW